MITFAQVAMKKTIEDVRLIKTRVAFCSNGHWIGRAPAWFGDELGKGFQCHKCYTTSDYFRDGRPFGPRYRYWKENLEWLEEHWETLASIVEEMPWDFKWEDWVEWK